MSRRSNYSRLLLSMAEISLRSKIAVRMPRGKNNDNFLIYRRFLIHIVATLLCVKFDFDILEKDF